MIIILSPSKTQDFSQKLNNPTTKPKYNKKANQLVNIIQQLTKVKLGKIMKIKNKLLDQTYHHFQNYQINSAHHAITSYTGFVFKEIHWQQYTEDQLQFINQHLRILSALYGVLKPFDEIKPYRLDMNMKVLDHSLYDYWSIINNEFKNEELIINCASNEFSQLIKTPMINIHFLENKNGQYKNIGTYAKKARGLLTNYIIINKFTKINDIKTFNLENYQYNDELSTYTDIYFTR